MIARYDFKDFGRQFKSHVLHLLVTFVAAISRDLPDCRDFAD